MRAKRLFLLARKYASFTKSFSYFGRGGQYGLCLISISASWQTRPRRLMMNVEGPLPASLTLRDGVRLDADIYRPSAAGIYPVLLMRQPYGRRIASTVVFAHPRWYAAQGYVVVIQDVRGTGTSEGQFRTFEAEQQDGAETLAWAACLPGTTGRVGMYGFSYQAVTQLLALAGCGKELATLIPTMAGWDIFNDWAYEGGAFRMADNIGWGLQMAAIRAVHEGQTEAFNALARAAKALPLSDAKPAYPDILEQYADLGHFTDWVEQDEATSPYWRKISPSHALATHDLNVPMLHIGGWYDTMLMGTLGAYQTACERSQTSQYLVVGPWPHLPWGRVAGGDMGPAADNTIDMLQRDWFDMWLKESIPPIASGLSLFDVSAKGWRYFSQWPTKQEPLFLHSGGLAGAGVTDGVLQDHPSEAAQDDIVHDPWRPVLSCGGHDAAPAGRQDRTMLDQRADIACYTSEAFEIDRLLAGFVGLELYVAADSPCFDVSAVLSEVTPEGRAIILTQGYSRITNTDPDPVSLSLRAICATIKAGSRLRLSLAGASYPAHPVNPGTGAGPADARYDEAKVITLTFAHGRLKASHLILPWADPATPLSHSPLRSLGQP